MTDSGGYRVTRLKERRRGRLRRWQSFMLYVLAAVVAFGAVVGALRLAGWIAGGDEAAAEEKGYLLAMTFGVGEAGRAPMGLLTLRAGDEAFDAWTLPRSLLLSGPQGEYIMAGDDFDHPEFAADLGRVLQMPVAHVARLPLAALAELAGDERLVFTLEEPATVEVEGIGRTYEGRVRLPSDQLVDVLGAGGEEDEARVAFDAALLRAVFDAAAARPEAELAASVDAVAAQAGDEQELVHDALAELVEGETFITALPSEGRIAEGQFALVPDAERIQATITRRAPGYDAPYTVLVRNGSGELGIGDLVVQRLAVLDVELPPADNADSFDYRETQIQASAGSLGVAREIRAILGRGVVLRGAQLPPDTIIVVVGSDLQAKDLQ
ncbi:MAG: LytR C-terminal domain-containing protein [Thermoleophilia bacterium]|nr:LytR C-terminal domain-containing protein [Thermoleophilia bacterium]